MNHVPRISEAEWRVMKVLWERSPQTATQVIEQLVADTAWKPKTIKTLLNRLVLKKALGYEQEGRSYLYFPRVDERDCVREESHSFLQRVYGGSFMPMLAGFLEDEQLSPEQIEELKRILDRKANLEDKGHTP